LPAVWQTVALANPILYMVNAFRYGILGTSDVSLTVAFAIIIGSFVTLFALVLMLLHRGTGIRT
jgi:ABC-2 type transport system permease protein